MKIVKIAGGLSACVLSACLLAGPALAEQVSEPSGVAASDESLLLVEHGSDNLWVAERVGGKPPRYSDKLLHRRVESCAAVGMIIEADGTTSGHRILDVRVRPQARANDAELVALVEEWAIANARQYRFKPGIDNPAAQPGFTAMWFGASRGGTSSVVDECAVRDLKQALAQLDTARPAGR